jgi:hypothetical protein
MSYLQRPIAGAEGPCPAPSWSWPAGFPAVSTLVDEAQPAAVQAVTQKTNAMHAGRVCGTQ